VAAYGEYPAQNLLADWEKLFRHFAPPNPGQRHYPLLYEVSQAESLENPAFIWFLFAS
jgi:hypothetical protein